MVLSDIKMCGIILKECERETILRLHKSYSEIAKIVNKSKSTLHEKKKKNQKGTVANKAVDRSETREGRRWSDVQLDGRRWIDGEKRAAIT